MSEPLWLKNPPPRLKLDGFKQQLYPFQNSGAIFLAQNPRCLLIDSVGLGKTPQSLAAYSALIRKRPTLKCVIVCPSSLTYQWESEAAKFTHYNFLRMDGNKYARLNTLKNFSRDKFVHGLIMTYDIFRRDFENLNQLLPFDDGIVLILDEAQKVKNPSTKISKSVRMIAHKFYGIKMLTATPLFNQVIDLFGLFKILSPSLFNNYQEFLNTYTNYFMKRVNNYLSIPIIIGTRNLDELKTKTAPYVFGRSKKQVYDQLPDLTFVDRMIELPTFHREIYDNLDEHKILLKADGETERVAQIAAMTKLQRCADALEHLDQDYESSHPKIDEIISMIDEEFSDDKIIVYSKFTSSLDILSEELKTKKIPCFNIDGRLSTKERDKNKADWEATIGKAVLLISSAGGAGLNLQAAGTIIFLNYPWSYGELQQIYGRIHRIGSKHSKLLIINVFAKHTIDEYIRHTLESKRSTFNEIFQQSSGSLGEEILNKLNNSN